MELLMVWSINSHSQRNKVTLETWNKIDSCCISGKMEQSLKSSTEKEKNQFSCLSSSKGVYSEGFFFPSCKNERVNQAEPGIDFNILNSQCCFK